MVMTSYGFGLFLILGMGLAANVIAIVFGSVVFYVLFTTKICSSSDVSINTALSRWMQKNCWKIIGIGVALILQLTFVYLTCFAVLQEFGGLLFLMSSFILFITGVTVLGWGLGFSFGYLEGRALEDGRAGRPRSKWGPVMIGLEATLAYMLIVGDKVLRVLFVGHAAEFSGLFFGIISVVTVVVGCVVGFFLWNYAESLAKDAFEGGCAIRNVETLRYAENAKLEKKRKKAENLCQRKKTRHCKRRFAVCRP